MKKSKTDWMPYLLLSPAIIIIVVLMGYPFLDSIRISLLNYNLLTPGDIYFNHFQNYLKLFQDKELSMVIWNSVKWVFCVVSLQFVLGFTIAMILNTKFFGKGIYQAVTFLPWAVSGFLIGLIFKFIFNQDGGILNTVLISLHLIEEPISWLGTEKYSMAGPIAAMVWYGIPFFGIMILAALQSISTDILEAAGIDGANGVQLFFMIIIPLVKPTIVMTLLLRVIWVFNSPDVIYVMTNGGPANTSNILPLYVFNQAFYTLDFGYGAAVGILMMFILAAYAVIYLRITKYESTGENE